MRIRNVAAPNRDLLSDCPISWLERRRGVFSSSLLTEVSLTSNDWTSAGRCSYNLYLFIIFNVSKQWYFWEGWLGAQCAVPLR